MSEQEIRLRDLSYAFFGQRPANALTAMPISAGTATGIALEPAGVRALADGSADALNMNSCEAIYVLMDRGLRIPEQLIIYAAYEDQESIFVVFGLSEFIERRTTGTPMEFSSQ